MENMYNMISFIYQYVVLISVVGLLVIDFLKTGSFNEILLGALVGVMATIPINDKKNTNQ